MKKETALSRIRKRIKPENKVFVRLGVDIGEQVRHILKTHPNIKTQKALAEALDKEESEVSKWLSGLHNITLESISKLTAALNQDIIMTDLRAKEKYATRIYIMNFEESANTESVELKDFGAADSTQSKNQYFELSDFYHTSYTGEVVTYQNSKYATA